MQKSYDICGIGAALVDTEINVSDADLETLAIAKGMMTLVDESKQAQYLTYLREHIDSAHRACGGSAANTLIAASYMGCKNFMTCRVANDEYGEIFLADLGRAGIEYNHNGQSVMGDTGKCLVMITPDAERSMNTCLAVSASMDSSCVHPEIIAASDWVYIEGYLATSDANFSAAKLSQKIARENSTRIALSLSDPGIAAHFRQQLKDIAGGRIDLLFCNKEEAIAWTEEATFEKAVEALKQHSKAFAVTLGAEGALIYDGKTESRVHSPKVKAVDTNGAGDNFAGAYLAALSAGANPVEAGEFACRCAALLVQTMGPRLDGNSYRKLAASEPWNKAA
jgi:sugar/nucleoside kinase (ribokinase family)